MKTIKTLIKQILGIVMIATFIAFGNGFRGENFIINVLLLLPQWIAIFVFFDWRDWVNK